MIPKFPLIVTLVIAGLIAWQQITAHVMRSLGTLILMVLWLVLLGLWWALRKRGVHLIRLGILIVGFAAISFTARRVLRYEGSADGSAFPQLVFRWQKKNTPVLPKLPAAETAAPAVDEPPPAGAADMPRFLGAAGDGILLEPDWQTDWQAHPPREVWRQAIGLGWSGFAVAGRRAITQEQRGEDEYVTCYDLTDGKLLWSHADKALFTEALGGDGPRATPTVDVAKGVVFALGGTGILNCLDVKTGAVKWSRKALQDAGNAPQLEWGKSSSPLLIGDVVVCSGGSKGASLLAWRRDSGELSWTAGDDGGSYSSPVLLTLAGREQIVSVNRESVTGHDPVGGKVLWTFAWPGKTPKVCQPVAVGTAQVLLTSSYGKKSHLLEIGASGETLTCKAVWSSTAPRTKFSSASVFGTHAYALDEGTLACVDLATGERGWRDGRYGFGQQIRVGEHWLLVQAEKGFVALVKPNAERLDEVSRLEALSAKTWNPPTLAGRWLLVRNDREVICFEIPAK